MTRVCPRPTGTRIPYADRRTPTYWDALLAEAAKRWHVGPEDITGPSRAREAVRARQAVMWVLRDKGLSFPHIAHLFGRDHSTVWWGVRAVETSRMRLVGAMSLRIALGRLTESSHGKVRA